MNTERKLEEEREKENRMRDAEKEKKTIKKHAGKGRR